MHVSRPQGSLLGAGDGLLTQALHVERDLALAVGPEHPGVKGPHRHHVPQAHSQRFGSEVWNPRANGVAVAVQDPDELLAHQRQPFNALVKIRFAHLPG